MNQHFQNSRTDWTRAEIAALFDSPFTELLFQAACVHREFHSPTQIQLCTLLSIKTGGCPEDCGYCSQSVKADSGVEATKLMDVQAVLQRAAQAKDAGSQRFCMGAAWRNPKDRDMPAIVEIVKGVRDMGLETCMTLGMLEPHQAEMLAEAGLDLPDAYHARGNYRYASGVEAGEALAAASSAFAFTLVGIGVLIIGSAVAAATWARSLNGWALGGV